MSVATVHRRSIETAAVLSGYQVVKSISPLDVISVLNANGISFVLVGAYGLAGWTKAPRATQDVDVLVASRQHKKAVRELLAAFPHLEVEELDVVSRLSDRETHAVAIDVMKPTLLYRAIFKPGHTEWVETETGSYRIPSLEMALAMKFAPMSSLHRADAKKYLDAHDFILMVQSNPEIDLEKLAELGELVFGGGGKNLLELVRKVRAGEKLVI